MGIPLSIANVMSKCFCYNMAKCRSALNFCVSVFKNERPVWLKHVWRGGKALRFYSKWDGNHLNETDKMCLKKKNHSGCTGEKPQAAGTEGSFWVTNWEVLLVIQAIGPELIVEMEVRGQIQYMFYR